MPGPPSRAEKAGTTAPMLFTWECFPSWVYNAKNTSCLGSKLMADKQLLRNLEELAKMSELGADWVTVAHFFGLTVEDLDALTLENPEIQTVFLRAKAVGKVHVMTKLRERIDKGSFMAMKLYLETQAGWAATSKTEISGPNGGPIATNDLSWAKDRLGELLARRTAAPEEEPT